jgi:metal-dependent amidase/aminoacylase/carboxypeptidase family protein
VLQRPQTGAEDFSFIAERVPSVYIQLGGRPSNLKPEDAADRHTPDFFIDDCGPDLGVRAMTTMALHYVPTHPSTRSTSER